MAVPIKGTVKALSVSDILRIAETEGAEAADAALRRIAQARETGTLAKIDETEELFGELGAEPAGEVIESLGELDATAIDAVEGMTEKAETYETHDVLGEERKASMKLRDQMRAVRTKIDGGAEVTDDDPLAKDKKKIVNTLKKVGRTLADLSPDWDKLPRIAKIPGERSRQSEVYRVFSEGQEEMREAERLRELEKRGRPANYDLLSADERDRVNVNMRQRRHRDKKRTRPSKPIVAPLPLVDIAPDMLSITLTDMLRSLKKWVANCNTPLSRQLRKAEHQRALIRAAAAYARYFGQHDEPPSHAQLAKWLSSSTDHARRKLDVLKSLYAPGGPWASA